MEKIHNLTALDNYSQEFEINGGKWTFKTGWGDITLESVESKVEYVLDTKISSVTNISLILLALNKSQKSIAYEFSMNEEKEKCLLQIKTEVETVSYVFPKKGAIIDKAFMKSFELLIEESKKNLGMLPYVGMIKISKWIEYSLRDIVGEFDYSFLGLKKTPIVFLSTYGKHGYTAIRKKSNTGCQVYVHWCGTESLPTITQDIIIEYCIFPQEEKPEIVEDIKSKEIKQDEEFESYAEVREAIKKGRDLVIYEDQVIDIKEFVERHPGLPVPLRGTQGREIGRWIYGSIGFGGVVHPHTSHFEPLLQKYKVGNIVDPLIKNMYQGIENGKQLTAYRFKFGQAEGITDVHGLIKLKNSAIKIQPQLNNPAFFGRYYTMSSVLHKTKRNFACVWTAEEAIMKEHLKLAQTIERKEEYKTSQGSIEEVTLDYIPFIVKGLGSFSNWLVEGEIEETEAILGGPYGPGLELAPDQKGPVVAISGGIAITHFIDLVSYLMRMNANKIGASVGKTYKLFPDEKFMYLTDPSFKLILFTSFGSTAVPMSLLLKTMDKWETAALISNFKWYSRIKEKEKSHWDEEYFKGKIPADASKIILAGSLQFVSSITDTLVKCGFSKDIITYL